MDWLRQTPIAHRGFHNDTQPENGLSAFKAGIERGYAIELDVHLLADGEVAVFHDKTLERMTGKSGKIGDQTLESLKDYRLLNTDEKIPTLAEALSLINGQVPVLIELKNEGTVGALEQALLKTLAGYTGQFAVQAFNPYSLQWFKQNAPQIPRGQLSGNFQGIDLPKHQTFLLKNLLLNWASQPDFIAYDLQALPNLPTTVARKIFNLPLLAWTIRNSQDQEKAKKYADNIIFDPF